MVFRSCPVVKDLLAGYEMAEGKNNIFPQVTRKAAKLPQSAKRLSNQMDANQIQEVESNICSFAQRWRGRERIYKQML